MIAPKKFGGKSEHHTAACRGKLRGRRVCKGAVTESVTEKTPPVLWQQSAGKGEKAR